MLLRTVPLLLPHPRSPGAQGKVSKGGMGEGGPACDLRSDPLVCAVGPSEAALVR